MLNDMIIVYAMRCRNHVLVGLDGDAFVWLLDVLVPAGLCILGAESDDGIDVSIDTYDEVTEPFLRELQRRFDGWTDLGTVRTSPLRLRGGAYGDQYQMQYRRMLIATDRHEWQEILETAERIYREGYLGWQHSLAAEAKEAVSELFLRDRALAFPITNDDDK